LTRSLISGGSSSEPVQGLYQGFGGARPWHFAVEMPGPEVGSDRAR
jgi:hypothetical protein